MGLPWTQEGWQLAIPIHLLMKNILMFRTQHLVSVMIWVDMNIFQGIIGWGLEVQDSLSMDENGCCFFKMDTNLIKCYS